MTGKTEVVNRNRRKFLLRAGRLGGAATLSTVAGRFTSAAYSSALPPITEQNTSRAPAKGPLRVLNSNPRFFTDGSGKAVYLAGSHVWWNFQDNGHRLLSAEGQDPPPVFDFNGYLDFLTAHDHNFFRLWRWEAPKWGDDQPRGSVKYCQPQPWVRTGPGLARDGKPKFDLTRFNPEYFDRMRARVSAAYNRGIYVSILLFEGWELQYTDAWRFHPFNGPNNVNGIDPEPDTSAGSETPQVHLPASAGEDIEGLKTAHYGGAGYVGAGLTFNTMQVTPIGKRVLALQEAYVRKVIDTVNDLDNVLYEICNEPGPHATDWQYHVINYVKQVESAKQKQHPVGMSFPLGTTNHVLYHSPADWIAPNRGDSEESYLTEPSSVYHGKVIVNDTDHLCGHTCGDALWVWKSFCHGLNVLIMEDLSPSPTWQDSARTAMGQVRKYAEKIDLAHMVPVDKVSETGYCLANVGREYLVFQPGNHGEFTLNLSDAAGTFALEWFSVNTGATTSGKSMKGGGTRTFPTPFAGPGVLYLKLTS